MSAAHDRRLEQVRLLHEDGLPNAEIAAALGVGAPYVSRLLGELGLRAHLSEAERARRRRLGRGAW